MNRRDSLKSLLIGGIGSGLLINCGLDKDPDISQLTDIKEKEFDYGRTPAEAERDEEIMSKEFYTKDEMATILILSDIIIPGDGNFPPASETGVGEFIEFITKDIPEHKIPMRGGLRWLENESYKRYNKKFKDASAEEQIAIVDDIAYPEEAKPEFSQGAVFFNRMRNLATTGYFTSKEGIKYLDYKGNRPNVWDGVPQEVMDKHGFKYDDKTLAQAIKPEERNDIQDWTNYKL
jgi:gluconate 2-dehydrogenase gamma chain